MRSSANFRTVLSQSKNMPTYYIASPKQILTQNGHSVSFRVICFGVSEKPLMGYIVQ